MFEHSLLSPDQHWALFAILFSVAVFGLWAEKTKIGSKLSAVVVSILATFVLSNLSIIPSASPSYDIVWSYLVPLAIPLLLFRADLRRIIKESGPTLIAYFFGAIGTVLGTVIAFNLIPLGEEGWKLAGIFCSTYIGGSMNYVAAAEALQLRSSDLLAAGVAADNLMMTIYFIILFALPSVKFLKKHFSTLHDDAISNLDPSALENNHEPEKLDIMDIGKALAIGLATCAVGFALQDLIAIKGSGILIITLIVVILATAFPKQMKSIRGADQIGVLLMQVFFAAIGASANIIVVIKVGAILFVFAALILFIHLLFILTMGKVFKIDLAEIVIASNANMGGPTTAAAMAVARKWESLVIPAILCGTLGYATATFIGVAVGYWLH
ncbi:hypothetical protein BMS3Abin04_00345 [bacterium BMS3Abin04]|nr:hypothetical protein BMS3Abin04_00345 [bacterium BMS3Abin04]